METVNEEEVNAFKISKVLLTHGAEIGRVYLEEAIGAVTKRTIEQFLNDNKDVIRYNPECDAIKHSCHNGMPNDLDGFDTAALEALYEKIIKRPKYEFKKTRIHQFDKSTAIVLLNDGVEKGREYLKEAIDTVTKRTIEQFLNDNKDFIDCKKECDGIKGIKRLFKNNVTPKDLKDFDISALAALYQNVIMLQPKYPYKYLSCRQYKELEKEILEFPNTRSIQEFLWDNNDIIDDCTGVKRLCQNGFPNSLKDFKYQELEELYLNVIMRPKYNYKSTLLEKEYIKGDFTSYLSNIGAEIGRKCLKEAIGAVTKRTIEQFLNDNYDVIRDNPECAGIKSLFLDDVTPKDLQTFDIPALATLYQNVIKRPKYSYRYSGDIKCIKYDELEKAILEFPNTIEQFLNDNKDMIDVRSDCTKVKQLCQNGFPNSLKDFKYQALLELYHNVIKRSKYNYERTLLEEKYIKGHFTSYLLQIGAEEGRKCLKEAIEVVTNETNVKQFLNDNYDVISRLFPKEMSPENLNSFKIADLEALYLNVIKRQKYDFKSTRIHKSGSSFDQALWRFEVERAREYIKESIATVTNNSRTIAEFLSDNYDIIDVNHSCAGIKSLFYNNDCNNEPPDITPEILNSFGITALKALYRNVIMRPKYDYTKTSIYKDFRTPQEEFDGLIVIEGRRYLEEAIHTVTNNNTTTIAQFLNDNYEIIRDNPECDAIKRLCEGGIPTDLNSFGITALKALYRNVIMRPKYDYTKTSIYKDFRTPQEEFDGLIVIEGRRYLEEAIHTVTNNNTTTIAQFLNDNYEIIRDNPECDAIKRLCEGGIPTDLNSFGITALKALYEKIIKQQPKYEFKKTRIHQFDNSIAIVLLNIGVEKGRVYFKDAIGAVTNNRTIAEFLTENTDVINKPECDAIKRLCEGGIPTDLNSFGITALKALYENIIMRRKYDYKNTFIYKCVTEYEGREFISWKIFDNLRQFRNDLAHLGAFKINNEIFDEIKVTLKNNIVWLAYGFNGETQYAETIDEIFSKNLYSKTSSKRRKSI